MTTTVLNTKIKEVGNKLTGISGLVKKRDYVPKITDIEVKYFTISIY